MKTTDMNTAEGLVEHFKSLPTANLEAIAAGPIFNAESATMILAAGVVIDLRKASA